jgi:hypothetical protein
LENKKALGIRLFAIKNSEKRKRNKDNISVGYYRE